MKLIVGLGNPGDKYKFTRHNAGFMALDYLSFQWGFDFKFESKFNGEIAKINHEGESIVLLKPHTYMNLSGQSLIAVTNFYKIQREDILVIYDDLAMPTGKLRFRAKGSDGGHNGIKSIIAHLNSDEFKRVRIGIGHKPADAIDYVLGCFSKADQNTLNEVFDKAPNMIDDLIYKGIDYIMNHYNG